MSWYDGGYGRWAPYVPVAKRRANAAVHAKRLEKKREYEDMVSLTRFGDPAMHAKVKKEVESAFQREPDFGR